MSKANPPWALVDSLCSSTLHNSLSAPCSVRGVGEIQTPFDPQQALFDAVDAQLLPRALLLRVQHLALGAEHGGLQAS